MCVLVKIVRCDGWARVGLVLAFVWMIAQAATVQGQVASVVLERGATLTARFSGDELPRDFILATVENEYLNGIFEAKDAPLSLALVDETGKLLRQLVDRGYGRHTFHFLAAQKTTYLRVSGAVPAVFSLTLISPPLIDTPLKQAPVYLSPAISRVSGGGNIDAFWCEVSVSGTPLVETTEQGVVMTFLARGVRDNARLLGGPVADHTWLEQLGNTDIWFASFLVPPGTRLSYQIARDVPLVEGSSREQRLAILATAQRDPFNLSPWPVSATDRFAQWSTVSLPEAPALLVKPDEVNMQASGHFTHFMIDSERLGNRRNITFYQPVGVEAGHSGLLFVFDGRAYQEKISVPLIIDRLMQGGQIAPLIVVFVANPDPGSRAHELPANPDFADFMALELLPEVSQRLNTRFTADRIALAGSSYGGLAAATIALRYPEVFGKVLAMSGSFWWHPPQTAPDTPNYVASLVAMQPTLPLSFFLSAGLFESTHPATGVGILEASRHLRDVLIARKVPVTFRQYPAGHDYFAWQVAIADGLQVLFPAHE